MYIKLRLPTERDWEKASRGADGRRLMGRTMRTKRYRYTEWLDRQSGEVAARELYDHRSDPAENRNVADEHPDVVARMTAKLEAWVAELPDEYEKAKGRGN